MAQQLKVSNYLLSPGTDRSDHPATMGSSWTCNMFLEKNAGNTYLASVPGLKFEKRISTTARCRGAYVSSVGLATGNQAENAFVCYGSTVWRIDASGERRSIGKVATGTARVTFAESGGARPFLLIADGSNLWAYDLVNGGELNRVTLPQRITAGGGMVRSSHVCVIDTVVVVNDVNTGYCYYSIPSPLRSATRTVFETDDQGNPVYSVDNPLKINEVEVDAFDYLFLDSYGLPQYFSAYTSSDAITAISAQGANLFVFGRKTVEIWQRGSGEYETWLLQSYTTNASNGLQSPYTLAGVGTTLFYLGSGESFAKGIMMVSGNSVAYEKISDDWMDRKLLAEDTDSAFAYSYAEGNHQFYVLNLVRSGQCWVYDLSTREWAQRCSRERLSGEEVAWRPQAMIWFRNGFHAFANDGCMYSFSQDYYWEDFANTGSRLPMVRHRQGAVLVNDEKRFLLEELAVECNVGTWDDYSETPEILLQVSRDGGNTFGNVKRCSLGRTGEYSHRVRFHHLGMQRLCVLRLTYSHGTALELTACSQRVSPTGDVI
jgi:hypothetical protein